MPRQHSRSFIQTSRRINTRRTRSRLKAACPTAGADRIAFFWTPTIGMECAIAGTSTRAKGRSWNEGRNRLTTCVAGILSERARITWTKSGDCWTRRRKRTNRRLAEKAFAVCAKVRFTSTVRLGRMLAIIANTRHCHNNYKHK